MPAGLCCESVGECGQRSVTSAVVELCSDGVATHVDGSVVAVFILQVELECAALIDGDVVLARLNHGENYRFLLSIVGTSMKKPCHKAGLEEVLNGSYSLSSAY